jgi:hypothetical protein
MSDQLNPEDLAAVLDELEKAEERNDEWAKSVLDFAHGTLDAVKQLLAKPEPPKAEPEPEPEPYAEELRAALDAQAEEFSAKLEAERKERVRIEADLESERRARRLAEFSEQVSESYASLPGTDEKFAADLMAIQDQDAERYERLSAVLKAADEAIRQGGLFEQFSQRDTPKGNKHPFLAEVDKVQAEQFSDLPFYEGYAKAFKVALEDPRNAEIARDYDRQSKGG